MALRIGRSRLPELLAKSGKTQAALADHLDVTEGPELLAKSGKTQAALADHLDVTEGYISQVIKGISKLSVINMKKTALFLGCHMDDLYEWIDD